MLKRLPNIKADDIKVNSDVQQLLLDEVLPFELFTKVCKDFINYIGYSKKEKMEIFEILNDQNTAYDVVYKLNISNQRWINLYFSMRNKDNKVNVIITSYEMYQDFLKLNNLEGKGAIPCNTITMFFKKRGAVAL